MTREGLGRRTVLRWFLVLLLSLPGIFVSLWRFANGPTLGQVGRGPQSLGPSILEQSPGVCVVCGPPWRVVSPLLFLSGLWRRGQVRWGQLRVCPFPSHLADAMKGLIVRDGGDRPRVQVRFRGHLGFAELTSLSTAVKRRHLACIAFSRLLSLTLRPMGT